MLTINSFAHNNERCSKGRVRLAGFAQGTVSLLASLLGGNEKRSVLGEAGAA